MDTGSIVLTCSDTSLEISHIHGCNVVAVMIDIALNQVRFTLTGIVRSLVAVRTGGNDFDGVGASAPNALVLDWQPDRVLPGGQVSVNFVDVSQIKSSV